AVDQLRSRGGPAGGAAGATERLGAPVGHLAAVRLELAGIRRARPAVARRERSVSASPETARSHQVTAIRNMIVLYVLRHLHRYFLELPLPGAADITTRLDKLMAHFRG